MSDDKNVKKSAEEMANEINEAIGDIREMAEKSATKEAIDAVKTEFEKFKLDHSLADYGVKMDALEQTIKQVNDKVGKISINQMPRGATLRERIEQGLKTDAWEAHLEKRADGPSPSWELKDINWGAAGASGTNDVVHNQMPFTVPQYPFEEPFDVRVYIPMGTVNTGSLDYPQEKLYTDGMGTEPETGASTKSDITFEMKTENTKRIATFAQTSRRSLRNTPWLSAYLANRFNEKWVKLLNTQALVGDGTGDNLNGIVTQATAWSKAGANAAYEDVIPANESTLWDAVIAAKSQLYTSSWVMGNACFVNPITHFQLTVQKTTQREYAYDQVLVRVDEMGVWRINGMALVPSNDIPAGDFLIGMMTPNVLQLLLNGGIDMSTTQSHASNFISSLVTFRFEADVMMPIYRPYAFIKGTLATVQTDITKATP